VSRYTVRTRIEAGGPKVSAVLRRAATCTLEHEGAPPGDLTIVLMEEHGIRGLNRRFLGDDRPTDVLAFPHGDIDPDLGRRYYGDVILCLPQAERQANEAGHSLKSELSLLTVHGVLHLLGYDHAEPADHEEMKSVQRSILHALREKSGAWGGG
jgi:probable rRNA maturation factor